MQNFHECLCLIVRLYIYIRTCKVALALSERIQSTSFSHSPIPPFHKQMIKYFQEPAILLVSGNAHLNQWRYTSYPWTILLKPHSVWNLVQESVQSAMWRWRYPFRRLYIARAPLTFQVGVVTLCTLRMFLLFLRLCIFVKPVTKQLHVFASSCICMRISYFPDMTRTHAYSSARSLATGKGLGTRHDTDSPKGARKAATMLYIVGRPSIPFPNLTWEVQWHSG